MKSNYLKYVLVIAICMISFGVYGQNVITASSNNNDVIVYKRTAMSNVTGPIQSGQQFTYTIEFANYDCGNCHIEITDVIDLNLEIVSTATNNNFKDCSTNTTVGTGLTRTGRTINIATDPNHESGSYDITVRYPFGSTANNQLARNTFTANKVCNGVRTPITFDPTSDEHIETTAGAINPWGTISKTPFYPVVNGQIPASNPIANYEIVIQKDSLYQSNGFGVLNLDRAWIDENFPPCAQLTILSVNNGNSATLSGNEIHFNDALSGVWQQTHRVNVQVDYTACGYGNGDCVINEVVLNGTPVGEPLQTSIDKAEAEVCVVDTITSSPSAGYITKNVTINNKVPGCMGQYCISVSIPRGGLPMRDIDIADLMPGEIDPIQAFVSGNFNSAYTGTPRVFDIDLGGTSYPSTDLALGAFNNSFSGAASNSFQIKSLSGTILYPGESLTICFPFFVGSSVTVGQSIDNCATLEAELFDPTNPSVEIIKEEACVSFTVEQPKAKLCILKEVRNVTTSSGWSSNVNAKPTDIIEYRIRVQNNGSLNFTGNLTDALDTRLDYISSSSSGALISGNTIEWQNVFLGQNCSVSYSNNCFSNSSGLTFIVRAQVKPNTPPGNIDNTANISDGTLSKDSNIAKVNVVRAQVLRVNKGVNNGSGNYVDNLTVDPTIQSTLNYRLRIENLGNVAINAHQIVDDLPGVGDVYYPTSNPRGSNFSLTNYNVLALPTGYNDYFNASWYNGINCANVNTWQPSYTTGDKSLLLDNPSVPIQPGAILDFYFNADIPNPSSRVNGEKVVNSAYVLTCDPNQAAPPVRSNLVTVNMFIPPCDSCEDNGNFEALSNNNFWTTIGESPVHSEGNGIEVYTEDYNLFTDWSWITKVRIFMSELEPISDEGCESCHYNMDQVGNLLYNDFPTTLGDLTKESINYSGSTQPFVREVVYSGLPTTAFNRNLNPAGVNATMAIAFPDFNPLQCCGTKYKGCIKFVFEGPNCENCEMEYCFNMPDGPLFPPNCQPITVDIEEEQKDCCSTRLIPQISGGNASLPVFYEWSNSTGVIQSGSITPTDKGQLTVTQNGDYTIRVWYDCPDGTRYSDTATYNVTGIIPPVPPGPNVTVVSNTLTGNNGVLVGNFAPIVVGESYGYRMYLQQEYTEIRGLTQVTGWRSVPNSEQNVPRCSKNIPQTFSINYTKLFCPQSTPPFFFLCPRTYTNNFRLVIEWEDCGQGSTNRFNIPTTIAPIISTPIDHTIPVRKIPLPN